MLRKLFIWIMDKVFFIKERALYFCLSAAFISFLTEVIFHVNNLFSSSGSIFTLAGLFLNIKLTAHFHLKLKSGERLGIHSKYAMITARGSFGGSETLEEKEKVVKKVEGDEIWGASLMIAGTIIWGYGSYFITFIGQY